MAILVSLLIIILVAGIVWGGFVYSHSKIVHHKNQKLKNKLAHVETELANLKSKIDWSNN